MKKKYIILTLLIIIVILPIINYNFPWRLSNKMKSYKFFELRINEEEFKSQGLLYNKSYVIKDKNKINNIYNFFKKQRGYKYPSWFLGNPHNFNSIFFITFLAGNQNDLYIDLRINNNTSYLIYNFGSRYKLSTKTFDIEKFKSYFK